MTLQEDLKGKALALISQQMANWVVEIQRQIGEYQGNLVRSLDNLQESVARYDERINEADIDMAMAEVVANQPPPAAAGPGIDRLKASLVAIEKGASLSEVLTYLVNEVGQYVDRAAMFIVKGTSAIGWYARGLDAPDAIKQVNVPLTAETIFRVVTNQRHAVRGHMSQTPGTHQALGRLGGRPAAIVAVPLVLRDKIAAILYCDSAQEEIPSGNADLIEVLVQYSGKVIDLLSLAPKPAVGRATNPPGPAAAGREEVRVPPSAAAPAAPAHRPGPAPVAAPDEGSSTVMFNAASMAAMRQQAGAVTPPPRQATAPPHAAPAPRPAPAAPALSPEEQKSHEDAKRFARLVVSEIKLYNEAKVNEGRRNRDIYERLKEDIERGRQMYMERVSPHVRETTNYFYDELVRILAGGDQSALGPM